jgi:hypothetical protein
VAAVASAFVVLAVAVDAPAAATVVDCYLVVAGVATAAAL